MKGIILVGGYGTRLRPLTLTVPKPLVKLANKPMIEHQIRALAKAGVKDIVLAVNYKPDVMVDTVSGYEEEYGVKITFSVESMPLDTGGPLKLAEKILAKDPSPFIVINSDVICDYPFEDMIAFHKKHGGLCTVAAIKVDEPSKYGVMVQSLEKPFLVDRFVEKPKEFVGNKINAGIYVIDPKVLDFIELRPCSIEKEVFPMLVDKKELYYFELKSYWMDVGQPKDFLTGNGLYLDSLAAKDPSKLAKGDNIVGNVIIDPSAHVSTFAKIGPKVVIGPNCTIGDGARIRNSVVFSDSKISEHALVKDTIVGWRSNIGQWCRLEGTSVLGDDVKVKDEVYLNGAKVLPHKTISDNVPESQIIM